MTVLAFILGVLAGWASLGILGFSIFCSELGRTERKHREAGDGLAQLPRVEPPRLEP